MSQELCIRFPKPQNNEMTNCPVWFIIDPRPDWNEDGTISVRDIGLMFDGPFFSREEAAIYLEEQRHHYTDAAKVYCKSGHVSPRYKAAFVAASDEDLKPADAMNRISEATGARTQEALAELLGIRQSSISDAKRRGAIPDSWLMTLLRRYHLNPIWLLTGTGAKYLAPADEPQ